VQSFLAKQLNFGDIPAVIAEVMAHMPGGEMKDLDTVLATDQAARERARSLLAVRAPLVNVVSA